jgi:hypothetical protein
VLACVWSLVLQSYVRGVFRIIHKDLKAHLTNVHLATDIGDLPQTGCLRRLKSRRPSFCTRETIWEQLNRFSWNLVMLSFTKICRLIPVLFRILKTLTGSLHEDLHVLMHTAMIEWGIPNLGISWMGNPHSWLNDWFRWVRLRLWTAASNGYIVLSPDDMSLENDGGMILTGEKPKNSEKNLA